MYLTDETEKLHKGKKRKEKRTVFYIIQFILLMKTERLNERKKTKRKMDIEYHSIYITDQI